MQSGARDPYFSALFDAAKALHSSLSLDDILQEIVRRSAEALKVRASALRLLDPSGEYLVLAAHHGLSEDYLSKGPVSRERSSIDRQALRGEPVVVMDAASDPRFQYRDAAEEEGFRSVLCVPLMLDDRGIGVLRVYSWERHAFADGETELLTAMATLGAIALRNAERFRDVNNNLRELEQYVTASW